MSKYEAINVRWTEERESVPILYQGKILCTEATSQEEAVKKFESFTQEHTIQTVQVHASLLETFLKDKQYLEVN